MPARINKMGVEIPERLAQTYDRHQYASYESVPKWDYCTVNQFGQIEEVYCKCCGDRVMGLREWGDPEVYDSKDKQNTVIVRQKVRVLPFDNYAMAIMEMQDGSKHLTVACQHCCDKLREMTPEQLHAFYVADLASLAETASSKREMDYVDKMYERKPERVL